MEFIWDKNTISFMKEAYEFSDYNNTIVKKIKPALRNIEHICDVGCGLGYLSIALSPYVKKVTALDSNESVLNILSENIKNRNINNIHVKNTNVSALDSTDKYDAMIFCFFGSIDEILHIAKKHCNSTVFILKKNYFLHRFSVAKIESGNDTFTRALMTLKAFNIPYSSEKWEIELGQPFRNLKDAKLFFKAFSQDKNKSVITDAFIKSRLRITDSSEYTWYMPHKRKIGYIRLNAKDIPSNY